MNSSPNSLKSFSRYSCASQATESVGFPSIIVNAASITNVSKKTSASSQRKLAGASSSSSKLEDIITCTPLLEKKKYGKSSTTTSREHQTSIKSKLGSSKELAQQDISIKVKTLNGPEWKQPCKASVRFGEMPRFVGKCTGNETVENNKDFKKFTVTEDPRKKFCLNNPAAIRNKPSKIAQEHKRITKIVKIADNIDTPSPSVSSMSSICEEIDLDNPFKLDFRGLDRKNTYLQDEQDFQNQRTYRRVKRYMKRRDAKVDVPKMVDDEQNRQALQVPGVFDVKHEYDSADDEITLPTIHGGDSIPIVPEEPSILPDKQADLRRTEDKIFNRAYQDVEREKRYGRYRNLYLDRQKKATIQAKADDVEEEKRKDFKVIDLAEKDFQDFLKKRHEKEVLGFQKDLRILEQKRFYPHTLKETKHFQHKMKKSKRVICDKAKVKKQFYSEKGKFRRMLDARLILSPSSGTLTTLSEMSSDDEDDLVVGARGSKYFLRGFHYKLGTNPRGKFHQKEKTGAQGKLKGCITRSQWFDELAPKPNRTLLSTANPSTVKKSLVPDDPNLELFPSLGIQPHMCETSAVGEYRQKPLGRQYDRVERQNIRIKKPKTLKVKRFNLTAYMYGTCKKDYAADDAPDSGMGLPVAVGNLGEYIRSKVVSKTNAKRRKRRQRMHFLGIPCRNDKIERKKIPCAPTSSSESSDWIPDVSKMVKCRFDAIDKNPSDITIGGSGCQTVGLYAVQPDYNMPAPEFREGTLRHHPTQPRNYELLKVDSLLLSETVDQSTVPIMLKLEEDRKLLENIRDGKAAEYMRKFEARRHHDHWDPTHNKVVDVRYKPKQPQFKPPGVTVTMKKAQRTHFEKAYPLGENRRDVDLTLPQLSPLSVRRQSTAKVLRSTVVKGVQVSESSHHQDVIFHSRDIDKRGFGYPGREKFLELIKEMRSQFYNQKDEIKDDNSQLAIDKRAYLEELEEDLKSIKSCLSSLEDSICTNFTNDSGSFLMIQDKKLPMDFIRKSLVPFEEIKRSRFKAQPMEPIADYNNPYQTVPFAGQEQEQLALAGPKDKFFTFNTRLRNGLRLRLEVPPREIGQLVLGCNVKGTPKVATDLDELYIKDLSNCPPVKLFKRNAARVMIKDALRKKFESWLIQGKVVEQKIAERIEGIYAEEITLMKLLFDKLFAKWEKKEYESSMAIVHKVKPYYEATDVIKREAKELEKEYTILNMSIVYIENDWIRLTILQNFHYLLMENVWREEHDWIHRREDGYLENFKESIEKRPFVNIRKRDKDDAWAIKEFYDSSYKKDSHPICIVFPNVEEFNKAIERLKSKTFVSILELHYTMWILAELERKFIEFTDWCSIDLESKKKYAETKCEKQYFMERRIAELKGATEEIIQKPLRESIVTAELNQIRGCAGVVFEYVVPANVRSALKEDAGSEQQISMISEVIVDLLGQLEHVPSEFQRRVEKSYRKRRIYDMRLSREAVQVEKRIELDMQVVHRNLAPPYVKPKRIGKLPRSGIIKKAKPPVKKVVKISAKTRFFYNAFHDEDEDIFQLKDVRESFEIMDTIQESIVPFYFDHFLRINEYQPNYNFKTQTELRDGPEEKRVKVKSVLPEVQGRLERWEDMRKKIMEDNIKKNPEMYKNVKI